MVKFLISLRGKQKVMRPAKTNMDVLPKIIDSHTML